MNFMNVKEVARDFKVGKVNDRKVFISLFLIYSYLCLKSYLGNVIPDEYFYPNYLDQRAKMNLVNSLFGYMFLVYIYRYNIKIDNQDFSPRLICFLVPAYIRYTFFSFCTEMAIFLPLKWYADIDEFLPSLGLFHEVFFLLYLFYYIRYCFKLVRDS